MENTMDIESEVNENTDIQIKNMDLLHKKLKIS